MSASAGPIGGSGLLRVASLPVRFWLLGANSELFESVRRLERQESARSSYAARLAERIGQELVPNPHLSRADRALLLDVRRKLHRGDLIAKTSSERLLDIAASLNSMEGLTREIVALVDRDRDIEALSAEIERELIREQDRLLLIPEQIYRDSQVAKAILEPPRTEAEGSGSQPARNRSRHRFEREWRLITRAAIGTTPRDWFSQVALLQIETSECNSTPAITKQFTTQWTANVRATRLAFQTLPIDWPTPQCRLALNPLHWETEGQLVAMVLDQGDERTRVSVRRTLLLDAICQEVVHSVRTFAELAEALHCASEDEWVGLRSFVRHLVDLGILQSSERPAVRLERAAIPAPTIPRMEDGAGHGGWVDVYRYVETGIPRQTVRDLQDGVVLAMRLLELHLGDRFKTDREADRTDEKSWKFDEILASELDVEGEHAPIREESGRVDGLASSASSTTGFEKLVRTLIERSEATGELVIDTQLLNDCGAEGGTIEWPLDCLVRIPTPGASFTALIDRIWPSGMLDSRFADTLTDIHGAVQQVDAYRDFLACLEQLTGVLFVELLVPPLADGAANAVRRPLYTTAWTGDPHTAAYLRDGSSPDRFIPLNAIQIRRTSSGRLRAEVDGQALWPIHHATRSFSPPWDRLARILLASAPRVQPFGYTDMIDSLTRMPARTKVPRISLSGGSVISPAQWRIPIDQLWNKAAPAAIKIRELNQLRNRHSMPRWVYLPVEANELGVPCDLESIHTIRLIEHHAAGKTQLNVKEMLPTPDQALVLDGAHRDGDRLTAQFQIRFPCDESSSAMAVRIAPDVIAAYGVTDLAQRPTAAQSNCRSPPTRRLDLIAIDR